MPRFRSLFMPLAIVTMTEQEPIRVIRVLIIDDEPLARQHIGDRLAHEQHVEIAGEADNGDDAVEKIRTLQPDLVFLDVQMPGRSGLEVAQEIGESMPATIFTTAFDQYALKAFELAAVDYLVKPFDDDRFSQAFHRARRSIELQEVGRMTRRLMTLLQHEESHPASVPARGAYLDRIPVESRGQLRVVPVDKVDYITASGPYAELHVGDRVFAIRERMQVLETQLDPAIFFRTHRSVIVRLDRVDTLLRSSGGDYAVRLKDGTELSVSRGRREELEARLGA